MNHPIFLILLFLVPFLAAAEVDCRTACHSCHVKEQPLEILEIYCAMCQECKERRKDRLKMKMKLAKKYTASTRTTTTESFLQLFNQNNVIYDDPTHPTQSIEFGDIGLAELMTPEDIPEGCPTLAPCSDDEASSTTTSITTTTTTEKPCPPVKICKKKTTVPPPQPLLLLSPPSMPPLLPSPYSQLLPSPNIKPGAPPPSLCAYQSQLCPPPIPIFSVQHYIAPPQQWPMQSIPPLNLPPPFPTGHGFTAAPPKAAPQQIILSDVGKRTTDGDYDYMYIGLPKNVLRNKG